MTSDWIRAALAALGLIAVVGGSAPAMAQTPPNLGNKPPATTRPFTITRKANFVLPWRIAFLPDGRMLITEKPGRLWLVSQTGLKTAVTGVPTVLYKGQGGLLGVFLSPTYADDHRIYLTYAEPGEPADGENASSLALARATLVTAVGAERLDGLQRIWLQMPKGQGGQFGAAVAFSPDGQFLFLASGDRQRMTPARDPNQAIGKILRLTLDGLPAPGNPGEGHTGSQTVRLIDPPADTEAAKHAPTVSTYTFPGPNLAPAEIWSSQHRNPYGLAFAPDGRLWEVEHGPMGGDELNLILPARRYGWPLVSYGINYNGVPIPSPDTRPDLVKPKIYWTPVIAPGGMAFYHGALFPQWEGSLLIGGLGSRTLNRIVISGARATGAQRWNVNRRIRDVAVAPDGAVWMIEDAVPGGLYRLAPK